MRIKNCAATVIAIDAKSDTANYNNVPEQENKLANYS